MSKKTSIIGITAVLIQTVLIQVRAEEILTLEKALSISSRNNPQILEMQKSIDEAKGDFITAKSLPNLETEMEISGFRFDDQSRSSILAGGNISFEIRQGFDPPGVRSLKTEIARKSIEIQSETVKSVWSQVCFSVREVYAKIILDKKKQELAGTNLNIFRQFYSKIQDRFQSGKALKNDLQRGKIELIGAENAYLSTEKELNMDKAKLNLLLGREFDVSFDIEDNLTEEDIKLNLKEITSKALSARPDLKAEEIMLEVKTKAINKEKKNRLPATFIGLNNTREEYITDYRILFGISLPLWNLNHGEIQKTKAQKEIQALRVDSTKREALLDIYEAYLNVEFLKKQLELLKQSLEEGNELLRLADLQYSEGKLDFINYLDQVRTINETRINYYDGLFQLNNAINLLEKVTYLSFRKEEYLK